MIAAAMLALALGCASCAPQLTAGCLFLCSSDSTVKCTQGNADASHHRINRED